MQTNITEEEAMKFIEAGYALMKRLKSREKVYLVFSIRSNIFDYVAPHIALRKPSTGEFWRHEWQKGDTMETFLEAMEARIKKSDLFEQ